MLSLIVGSCIFLDGFVWRIEAILDRDTVKLGYFVPVRVDDSQRTKTIVKLEKQTSLWRASFVKENSKKIKCPKEFE